MVEKVGAQELRDRLTYYLRTVREGKTVVITVQGEPVARLIPIPWGGRGALSPEVEKRMWDLVGKGILEWSGTPCRLPEPVAENRGQRPLSELVKEGLEVWPEAWG